MGREVLVVTRLDIDLVAPSRHRIHLLTTRYLAISGKLNWKTFRAGHSAPTNVPE
jgi:hypothetical protein